LEELESQGSNIASLPQDVNDHQSTNRSTDFKIIDSETDALVVDSDKAGSSTTTSTSPQVQSRLHLQESIDGEISSNSNKSSATSDLGASLGLETTANTTDMLMTQSQTNPSIFSSINLKHDNLNDEWVNLTSASNMQDVDRPEPLGRTELTDSQPLKPSRTSLTPPDRRVISRGTSSSSSSILSPSSRSKQCVDNTKSTQQEIDIPDLSYTHSSLSGTLIDSHLNKRVGPAQDVNLQSSSNDNFSSLSSSSNEITTASRFSNETPVTKLLGPAYKQTERFLKDLQEAKLSYTNNESKLNGNEHGENNMSKLSVSSRDESIQVGRSKLDITNRSFLGSHQNTYKQGDLTEQDISSASIADAETSHVYKTTKVGVHENEHSEGELFISELSESSTRDVAYDRVSRSTLSKTSNTTISQASASLEPIKEVNSPNKSLRKSRSRDESSFNHQDEGDGSFAVDSMQQPISSTSTPYAEVTTSKPLIRGIYDIRNSTSPGSTNRKRIKRGKIPKSRDTKLKPSLDPHSVYVSEESQMTEVSRVSSKKSLQKQKSSLSGQQIIPEHTNNSTSNQRHLSITPPTPPPPSNVVPKYHLPIHMQPSLSETSDTSSTVTGLSTPNEKEKSLHGNLSTDDKANHLYYTTATESRVSTPSKSVPKRSFVFPKHVNDDINSDSSYHGNGSSSTNTDRSIEHEKIRRNAKSASLNELWESFERSYRDAASSDKSPLLKKLEVVSNLLKESRQRSLNHRHFLSETSDASSTYCESHTPFPSSRQSGGDMNKKSKSPAAAVNFDHMKDNKRSPVPNHQSVCPICQRREIGTNFPTPRASDKEEDLPLTLQAWTQTSPYLINNNQFPKYATGLKAERRKNPSLSTPQKNKPMLVRKETYTVFSPDKSNRSWSSSKSNRKTKDVPYTAWFQSVLSDVSDIVPLCKIPDLSTLYADNQDAKHTYKEKRYVWYLGIKLITLSVPICFGFREIKCTKNKLPNKHARKRHFILFVVHW